MKKILFSTAMLFMSMSIYAQTFNLGLIGGINSRKVTPGSISGAGSYTLSDLKADAKMGYHIGAFARLGGKKIFLQPELLYSVKKGANSVRVTDNTGTNSTFTQSFNTKSLQIPLLIGYKLINLKIVSLRVFTGPAVSINQKDSQVKLNLNTLSANSNVWDWWAGGGIDVGSLVFDVHYEWGITNLSNSNPSQVSFNNKGNTLTFSVGFKFL